MPYHPSPTDYWRWTHAGLEKLFVDNGTWASVSVTPASGTTACVAMIISLNVSLALRRMRLGASARPFVAALNGIAERVDNRSSRLRTPTQAGTLFANFHVVAEVAR
jgi:hypothetical protein